ncbi:MAG: cation:proton antiporter [Candidatus Saganbacteria bacterium]|nr:cation:proton antiporter [Candidatus Saganbacteria bacterium]
MGAVFDIGIILLVGYIGGRIATFLKLPAIIGYLIVGILLEPGVLGILPPHFISQSEIATNLALAVITFAIGGSLALSKIKKLGKSIVCITVFEAEFAFILVAVGMTFVIGWGGSLLQSLPMALLLAAMASPTDPTAILAIVDEYKTDGPVTRTLMAVAASDDALGIMNFSMATAFATALLFGARYLTIDNLVWSPLFIILSSIVAGIAFGAILTLVSKIMKHQGALLAILFGTLFTCFGLTTYLGLDQLLSLLVIGVVFVNFSTRNKEVFSLLLKLF